MNWKPIVTTGLYIVAGMLAGGGAMYSLPQSQTPQPTKPDPISVTCEMKIPDKFYEVLAAKCKHALDVHVYGAPVKK